VRRSDLRPQTPMPKLRPKVALATTMKKRKLIFFLAFVVIGVVACILILNILREEHVATIELPSGDRIVIKYVYADFLSALAQMTGGLKYDIYSGKSHSSGQLTRSHWYDGLPDAKLTYEIQGDRRVKIEDGRSLRRSWLFVGTTNGQYKVTELPPQKAN